MRRPGAMAIAACAVWLLGTLAACEREARPFSGRTTQIAKPKAVASGTDNPYNGNAYGVSEGKRLFSAYNCVGCHANGGGGMGPALMDERWIYGSADAQIFDSIFYGRANGMPAFGSRIPQSQIWMLTGYVRSLSGRLPIDVMPSRPDHLRATTPENVRPARMPPEASPQ